MRKRQASLRWIISVRDDAMIDIHAHMLPGIDDGAADIYDTLEMAEIAARSGIRAIIATPHCNIPGFYDNYFGIYYKELFVKTYRAIEREKIPVKLYPGMEVFATEDLPRLFQNGEIITLSHSKYLLVEFSVTEDPMFAVRILDKLKELGVKPVVAHAERYEFVQDNPQIVFQWRKKGYVIQANKGSFLGRFGKDARETVYRLLDHNLISVVASDAHSPKYRTPYLLEAYDILREECEKEYRDVLFYQNPARICKNKPILMPEPVSFEE